ncbi:hypothetical protein IWW45_007655 [Coemansia sp. RSA 485]|nr:hypothetical protein IWW45_007655 [Coemansia sp. RSA 485]
MDHIDSEQPMTWNAHEESGVFATPLRQDQNTQESIVPSYNPASAASKPPFHSSKSDSLSTDIAGVNWEAADLLNKNSRSKSSELSKASDLDTHLPTETLSVSFVNLSQPMPIKASALSGPVGIAYDSSSLMFAQNDISVSAADVVSTLATAITSAMSSSTLNAFSTTAGMATENYSSINSSPLFNHSGVASQKSSSPSILSGSTYPTMTSVPTLPAVLPMPLSREDLLEDARKNNVHLAPMDRNLSVDTRYSVMHSKTLSGPMQGSEVLQNGGESGYPNSADSTGYNISTDRNAGSGMKTDASLFPSLLHRICEDHTLDSIAYWDENSYVCIPVMENLRLQLNTMGMTANHTDSLQKNFNDYQFFRRTDQRRIRHTSELGIVKFSNPSFLPGREDLLHLIVRKSALKKMQNGVSRTGGSLGSRKKSKGSVRQGSMRMSRQSTFERMNPYARFTASESSGMQGFPLPAVSASSTMSSNQHNISMSMGMLQPDFGIQSSMSMMERTDLPMISPQQNSQLYFDQGSSNFDMSNMITQPMQLNAQGQYSSPIPMSQQLQQPQQQSYQSQYAYGGQQQAQTQNHQPQQQQYSEQQYFFSAAENNGATRNTMY